jgi:hypothetical protein
VRKLEGQIKLAETKDRISAISLPIDHEVKKAPHKDAKKTRSTSLMSLNGPLLCEGFRARQGLAQHLPRNRKTSFAFDSITPSTGTHLQML